MGEREPQAAQRCNEQQGGIDAPRPKAVEQQPERQLEQREGQEVHAGEQTQPTGAEPELRGERRPEHRIDHAVDIRDEIARDERQGDTGKEGQKKFPLLRIYS